MCCCQVLIALGFRAHLFADALHEGGNHTHTCPFLLLLLLLLVCQEATLPACCKRTCCNLVLRPACRNAPVVGRECILPCCCPVATRWGRSKHGSTRRDMCCTLHCLDSQVSSRKCSCACQSPGLHSARGMPLAWGATDGSANFVPEETSSRNHYVPSVQFDRVRGRKEGRRRRRRSTGPGRSRFRSILNCLASVWRLHSH